MLSAYVDANEMLLFVTDAAPYLVRAGAALRVINPKTVHVSRASHALHGVAEELRGCFHLMTSTLVSNTKKVSAKSPMQVQLLRDLAPDVAFASAACAGQVEHVDRSSKLLCSQFWSRALSGR